MNDINIRKAIAYGIDRERIVNNICLGHATVADYPVMPNSWLYDYSKIRLGHNPDLAIIFLDRAGYTSNGDNNFRTNEKGETIKLKLITNTGNPLRDQIALFIQEDLNKIGIQLEIEFLEWDDLENKLPLTIMTFFGKLGIILLPNIADILHSSVIGGANFIAYDNEELDALLDICLSDVNSTLKMRRFGDVEEHIAGELPYISLFFKNGANSKQK